MPGTPQPQSRQERRRQQRQHQIVRQQRRQNTRRWYVIGGIVALIVVLGGGGVYLALAQNGNSAQAGAAIDGLPCEAQMSAVYHVHAHLTLYQNGKQVLVPSQVGIPYNPAIPGNGCLYSLHTHDPSGVVHVESPSTGTYTLGEYFDVWHHTSIWDDQSTLASSYGVSVSNAFPNALGTAKPSQIHVYVNGQSVGSDYKGIELTNHKLITIELGTPLRTPTTHFNFGKLHE